MALYPTNYTLTQGSLHYRLPTLGYQKQNPYGVRLSHELPLRSLFHLTRDEIKKAQHLRRCTFLFSSFQKRDETQAEPFCRISACIGPLTQAHTSEKAHIGVE